MRATRLIPKATLMKLIARGEFQVTLPDGRKVTDWKSIEGTYHIIRERDSSALIAKPVVPKDGWTNRQYEHIGDAVFELAARALCHRVWGSSQQCYFKWAGQFLANSVMGGTPAEIRVGRIYVGKGIEEALKTATHELEQTTVYQTMLRHFASVEEQNKLREIRERKSFGEPLNKT